jgi:hypothetical protein
MLSINRGYVSRNNAKKLLVHAKAGVGEPRGQMSREVHPSGTGPQRLPGMMSASAPYQRARDQLAEECYQKFLEEHRRPKTAFLLRNGRALAGHVS